MLSVLIFKNGVLYIIFSLVMTCFEFFSIFEAGSIGQSRKKGLLQELGRVVVCFDLKKIVSGYGYPFSGLDFLCLDIEISIL